VTVPDSVEVRVAKDAADRDREARFAVRREVFVDERRIPRS
jgi:hypothetical protein